MSEVKEGGVDGEQPTRCADPMTDGVNQPFATFSELVRGGSLTGGTVPDDAAEFAQTLLCRAPGAYTDELRACLSIAGNRSDVEELRRAAELCRMDGAAALLEAAARFEYLAALSGSQDAARYVASEAIAQADDPSTPHDEFVDLTMAAIGWLAFSAIDHRDEDVPPRVWAAAAATRLFGRMSRERRTSLLCRKPLEVPLANLFKDFDLEAGFRRFDKENEDALDAPSVVVLPAIGNDATGEGKRVAQAFVEILQEALPLIPTPDVTAVRRSLASMYPHATGVLDAMLAELSGRDSVRMRPTILVGPPGCGKSSFARDLLSALDVPQVTYPCGGASDSSLAGNARRWNTGEPSLPLSLIARHRMPSPGIVLDEIEKVGTSSQNGRLHDALLGMLERVSAASWYDPYVQAEIDISHVVWIGTANLLEGIPGPLGDRFRILKFPVPDRTHLPMLGATLVRRACEEQGLDLRWAEPMDPVELRAVGDAWGGGSLRRLERLINGMLAARELSMRRN